MASTITDEAYQKELQQLRQEIERRTGKSAEELYEEREKRARDAIELREPDRIPFSVNVDLRSYTGVRNSAAYYEPVAYKMAMRKITLDLEPDMCNAGLPTSGDALEALGVTNRLWPGGPLPPDYEYQFVEGEYLKADEYDMFLDDPTDFLIRRFLPRMYKAFAPLAQLPPLGMLFQGFEGLATLFATDEFREMASKVASAGKSMQAFRDLIGDSYEELAQLGFPAFAPLGSGVGGAPYDALSSFLRGMQGAMGDMFRRPEKLLRACEMIVERRIANAKPADPARRGNPKKIGMPLWRGDKSFMSEAQFERFYWPGLKRALQANVDLGFVPIPFFEAEFGDRLGRLRELPAGKIVASIEYMDAVRAKELLGGHTCLLVRGPLSSRVWSLRQVEAYYKELIDKCGKGGGLMINVRLPDNVKKEDARAMLNSISEYGRYH
jgi:hypothetical protein